MPTKILHISDTHLGKRQYRSNLRREDYTEAFKAAVRIAIKEEVDAVLHTGDLFDSPRPPMTVINDCADILQELVDAGIPFYGIVGNHERKLEEQWLDLYERFDAVNRLDKEPTVINNEVALYGIDAVRSPSWETADFTLTPPEDDLVTILAMHELFEPLVPSHRGNPYSLSNLIDRLNFKPDGIALGDFHSNVGTTVNGVLAWYPGSTERCSSDETEERAVSLLEIDKDSEQPIKRRPRTISEEETTEVPRTFVTVSIDLGKNDNMSTVKRRISEEVKARNGSIDDYIVVVTLTGEQAGVMASDIETYLEQEGAAVINIRDKRTPSVDIDVEVAGDETDIDGLMRKKLQELELSDELQEIESLVRDTDLPKNSIRPKTNDIISEQNSNERDEE